MQTRLSAYSRLIRFERPVGTYLLLWPTLTSLWIASNGSPQILNIIVFTLGTFFMRSAGCAINDYADRKVDGAVARTQHRPLATGEISPQEALWVFAIFCLLSAGLVLLTNTLTILLSFGAVITAALYPFMKRYTHLPQVVLGAAFCFGIPMAASAELGAVPPALWLFWLAILIWVVVYDTFYAMVDRADDLQVGIKSTAILFGAYDKAITASLQVIIILLLQLAAYQLNMGSVFYVGIIAVAGFFVYQQHLIKDRDTALCMQAFTNNHIALLVLFIAAIIDTHH